MSSESKLIFEQQKCIGCGLCVKTCPAKVLIKAGNYVTVDASKDIFCLNCGDCISVCPNDAIKDSTLSSVDYVNSNSLDPDKLLSFFKRRRSIRSYKPEKLSEKDKEYLSTIASLAPRGGHTESIRNTGIIIIEDETLIEEIVDYTYEYINALKLKLTSIWIKIPKLLNTSFRNNINGTINRIDLILKAKEHNLNMLTYSCPNLVILHNEIKSPISKENLTIMEYQLMLGAEVLNLGTCFLGWVSFALQSYNVRQSKRFHKLYNLLEIPESREVSGVFSIGKRMSSYKKVKTKDSTVIKSF